MRGSFPCRWRWDLQDGFRAGYVTAGESADCGGRSGSLTLAARLFRWNVKTKRWHLDRAQTKTFRDLRQDRFIELAERCRASLVRAEFRWILRDAGGTIVARNFVKSGTLRVPSPDCQIQIR